MKLGSFRQKKNGVPAQTEKIKNRKRLNKLHDLLNDFVRVVILITYYRQQRIQKEINDLIEQNI